MFVSLISVYKICKYMFKLPVVSYDQKMVCTFHHDLFVHALINI